MINSKTEDTVKRISEITNGVMAQQVMECSGANAAIRSTLDLVSNAGRITLTGWPKTEPRPQPISCASERPQSCCGVWDSFGRLLKLGIPMGLQFSITAIGTIIVQRLDKVISCKGGNFLLYS